jgi:type 2 lantibiotic biosynthesis protein LanM
MRRPGGDRTDAGASAGPPVPFEELLQPIVDRARRKRRALHPSPQAPHTLLTDAAEVGLERVFLARLVEVTGRALFARLDAARGTASSPLAAFLGPRPAPAGADGAYRAFVERESADGLAGLFETHPVLARLVAKLVEDHAAACTELTSRLHADVDRIAECFGDTGAGAPGRVVALEGGLSDPHHGGRSVWVVTFESGLRVVYKPRPMGLERAFADLVRWVNEQGPEVGLRTPTILERPGYGWVEWIARRPCRDASEVERFYVRAGMLAALVHVLGGTDCHFENVIAHGDHPVLIDAETVLQPQPSGLGPGFPRDDRPWDWFHDSVLRTGFVPRWALDARRGIASDPSGLVGGDAAAVRRGWVWRDVNTDAMTLTWEPGIPLDAKNRPALASGPVHPASHAESVVAGFGTMWSLFQERRGKLLADGSPLDAFRGQGLRFVFRETRVYLRALDGLLEPHALGDESRFADALDRIGRPLMTGHIGPYLAPLLAAEREAMERLDVPRFVVDTSSRDLGALLPDHFETSGLDRARARVAALDAAGCIHQTRILRAAFAAHGEVPPAAASGPDPTDGFDGDDGTVGPDALLDEASAIGDRLLGEAFQGEGGALRWVRRDLLPGAGRVQIEPLGWSLYDGDTGVGLFLASLAAATGQERYAEAARSSLVSVRGELRAAGPAARARVAKRLGIGGASGLGSLVYGLNAVARLLEDDDILADAHRAVAWIHADSIATDTRLDVIDGCAGAILGLLALHGSSGSPEALDKAVACGERLLRARQETGPGGPGGWVTVAPRPLTGFSHGAAGIAYSLTRLHHATGESGFREAALDAMAHEDAQFVPDVGNWPDFRATPAETPPTAFGTSWCHGAPGIGLARLGMAGSLPGAQILADLEQALDTTVRAPLLASDGLCCGNLGLADILWTAGMARGRADWVDAGRRRTARVVGRARRSGTYHPTPGLAGDHALPGLFQGLSGVGLALLRQAGLHDVPTLLLWG